MAFTVADYILKRLSEQHVDRLFGVPAAYCAPLFDAAPAHGIAPVVTASDLEAGDAADGYARTKGLGAASVASFRIPETRDFDMEAAYFYRDAPHYLTSQFPYWWVNCGGGGQEAAR